MTGLSPFPPLLDRYRNLPDPRSQRSGLRPSSTVREIRLLALKYLRNVKSVLALHFRLGRLSLEFPQRRRYRHAGSTHGLRNMRRKLAAD